MEPSAPFYAIPIAGRMECPQCGNLLEWGPYKRISHEYWNPATSKLTCHGCRKRYTIGIVAWPANNDPGIPVGQRGTISQLLKLRWKSRGFWIERARKHEESTNIFDPGECTCGSDPWRIECPVHGEQRQRPDEKD